MRPSSQFVPRSKGLHPPPSMSKQSIMRCMPFGCVHPVYMMMVIFQAQIIVFNLSVELTPLLSYALTSSSPCCMSTSVLAHRQRALRSW